MRKIIAMMLAVVLIAGGLGGFVYAQTDPVNEVHVEFYTFYSYSTEGNSVDNPTADQPTTIHSGLRNEGDETGQDVINPTLDLSTTETVTEVWEQPEDYFIPGSTYRWEFPDIVENETHRGNARLDETVLVSTGLSVSRSVNPTIIPPTGGTQILTVSVTPKEAMDRLEVHGRTDVSGLDIATVTSVTGEGIGIHSDSRGFSVHIWEPALQIYQWEIEINIGSLPPEYPQVDFEYMLRVNVENVDMIAEGDFYGSSLSGSSLGLDGSTVLGDWTWQATGDYSWGWSQSVNKGVGLEGYAREIVEPIPHEPMTGQKLVGFGQYGTVKGYGMHTMFTFTNPDCVSKITIDRVSIFAFDGTVLYEGPLKVGKPGDEDPNLEPHEVDAVELHDYIEPQDPLMPVTVEIFWSGAKEGLPLTGWQLTVMGKQDAGGNLTEMTSSESPMVNMEQVLVPKVEKKVTTLRLQTWMGPDDPFMVPLENFAQAVEDGTKGSVRIELYSTAAPVVPNFWEVAEAVKQGEIEMGLLYSQLLRDYSRVMDAGWLPFLYNDDDGLMAAVEAGIGDLLSDELTGHNITALTWTTTAFSHLYSRDMMLAHPDDLTQDVKIRVIGGMGGAHEGMQWEAITEWGGTPVTLPFAEIYELLRDGIIHGAIHSPYLYEVMKFYEVAPHFCVDYAFANLAGLCINSDVWNSLDAKTQDDIAKAAGDYVDEMLETVKLVDAEALQQIQQHPEFPVEVYTLTPEERLVWREVSQPVWEWWLEELGDARPVGEEIIAIALEHNPLLAPPKTLRLQTWYQTEEPLMEPLENFAQAVEDGTKGSVRIELYPSNALVPNPEIAKAVRQGKIEMGLIFSAFLQETPSLVDAPQLPFLYNSEDGLMAAVKAGIGDLMSEQIEDITVLDWTTTGFAHLYNRLVMDDGQVVLEHPIIHPDDVDGLKIRSMGIPAEAIAAWGGMTLFTPFSELYQALAGKVIDGAMHSPYLYEVMNFYEVAPYFCVDYGFAELAGLCINSKVWKDMDADTQQIMTDAARNYADEMLETVKLVDAEALQTIEDYEGVTVYELSPAERLVWREASEDVWYDWADDVGPVGLEIIAIALEHNPLP